MHDNGVFKKCSHLRGISCSVMQYGALKKKKKNLVDMKPKQKGGLFFTTRCGHGLSGLITHLQMILDL